MRPSSYTSSLLVSFYDIAFDSYFNECTAKMVFFSINIGKKKIYFNIILPASPNYFIGKCVLIMYILYVDSVFKHIFL